MSKVRHFLVQLWLELVEQYPCQIRFQAFCTGDVKCKTDRRQMLHWGGCTRCVPNRGANSNAPIVVASAGISRGRRPTSPFRSEERRVGKEGKAGGWQESEE